MSAVIEPARPRRLPAIHVAWYLFTGLCLFYAVLAFDYFIGFGAGREGLWLHLLAASVSPDYAHGAGSVHLEQRHAYGRGLHFLLMHTMMGAVCLAVAPLQFSARLRRARPALHRTLGGIYLLAVLLSMLGGMAYLAVTPLHEVYSGRPFGLALWALDIMVLATALRAWQAIRARDFQRHQAWMAFNFGLILTTPMLRLLWVGLGVAVPAHDQAQVNLGITTFLLPLCLLGPLVWLTRQRRP